MRTLQTRSRQNAGRSLGKIRRSIADRHEDGPELLDPQTCLELLRSQTVGRLAYVAREGVPDIAPVNYWLDGDRIVVRSGPGPKLQAAERREWVAFEVDALDTVTRTGWSVVVVGRACVRPARANGPAPQPWATGTKRHVLEILPQRITGRRLGPAILSG